MATSSQKFIARNRTPRVQIEYDVELYGSNKKVELPFVAGVMADLSGDNVEPLGPVEERRFEETGSCLLTIRLIGTRSVPLEGSSPYRSA